MGHGISSEGKLVTIIRGLNKLESAAEGMLGRIIRVGTSIAAGLLIVWIFAFTGTVVARQFFHADTAYLEEYTGYWTLIITCLALAYTFIQGAHIRVDIVVKSLSQKGRSVIEVFVAFIALITSCIFFAHGVRLLLFSISENVHCTYSTTLLWPVYLWIPIGYGLLSLALFLYFCRTILVVLERN